MMRLMQKKGNRRFYNGDKMSLEDTKEADACACKCGGLQNGRCSMNAEG